tara:strand:- start:845 stop:1318 length:474 start_codon:yes stop_codon:yes gene_type:complete
MARITVEDCLEKINSQYDLVLLAKERTAQLNAGEQPLVEIDNDKNTVISLREIGEGKVSIKTLEDSAVNKLRKLQDKNQELDDLEEELYEDEFDKIYKGEVSKSGTAVLPSKRTRRMTEKVNTNIKKTVEEVSVKNEESKPKVEEKDESISAEKKQE